MSKRSNGEGSIRKRADNKWEGRYTAGYDPKTGNQIRRSVYGKTREEIVKKLREVQHHIDSGNYIEPSRITVADWLFTWLNVYKKGQIRISTYNVYHEAIRLHINPNIGNYQLSKIRPEHVQKMINIISNKLAPATVIKIKNILNNAFKQAVKNEMINKNIIEAVVAPKLKQREIKYLNPEDQDKFIRALKGDRLEPLFLLALGTGMRVGELLALTWDKVNLEEQTIKITHSLAYVKNPETNHLEFHLYDPKTPHSRRLVPLTNSVMSILRQHKKTQLAERLRYGNVYNDMGLLFCTELGGYLSPRNINRKVYKLVEKLGLPHISFHSLRHTFATRAFENDMKPKAIQEILGHSDISTTLNTYTHLLEDTKHKEMSKLENMFSIK
jgi:integrase